MNRYLGALLIFLFFWFCVGAAANGILTLAALVVGLNPLHNTVTWAHIAISITVISLGIFFGIQRIRKNTPWRMTPPLKALVFAPVYFVALQLLALLPFLAGIAIVGVDGSAAPPEAITKYLLYGLRYAIHYVIGFPFLFLAASTGTFNLGPLPYLLNSLFWATGYYLFLLRRAEVRVAGDKVKAQVT
jgi:hypothetical protein